MALKLKWRGVDKLSLRGKEMIEDTLNQKGMIVLATSSMPRGVANRIADLNNLFLDYESIMSKGKLIEYYVFRINHQMRLRDQLKKGQRLRFVRNLTLGSILVFLLSLLSQLIFWK